MLEIDQAIAQIADIRVQLAASSRFRGYAPEAVAMIGLVFLLTTLAQFIWPSRFAVDDAQQVLLWGLLLLVAGLMMASEAVVRSNREHGGMGNPMFQAAVRAMLPVIVVGATIPAVVLTQVPQIAWIVPGIWQMLIGVAVFASYASMPRSIVWPGIWYLFSGAVVLLLSAAHGALTPVLVGAPFVAGHFAIAWILSDRDYRRNVA